jgi:CheY-like chemotaxis protein
MKTGNYILCVDDDKDDSLLLAEAISNVDASLQVKFEEDGEKALKFLSAAIEKKELPKLIVLDLNMPAMDGKQALTRIKADQNLKDVPVLVLSTSVTDPDILELENKGVSIFAKPTTVKYYDEIARSIVNLMSEPNPKNN